VRPGWIARNERKDVDGTEHDELLIRLDERTKTILDVTRDIKKDVNTLFGQTRDLESRISNVEGNRTLMFKLFGSGGLLAGLGYGISEVIKKIVGNG